MASDNEKREHPHGNSPQEHQRQRLGEGDSFLDDLLSHGANAGGATSSTAVAHVPSGLPQVPAFPESGVLPYVDPSLSANLPQGESALEKLLRAQMEMMERQGRMIASLATRLQQSEEQFGVIANKAVTAFGDSAEKISEAMESKEMEVEQPNTAEEIGAEMAEKKIEAGTSRICKEVFKNLEENGKRFSKLKDQSEKMSKDIQSLEDGRVPSGMKPFHLPFENLEFDKVVHGEKVLTVTLPSGKSTRERMEILYRTTRAWEKQCLLDIMEKNKEELKNKMKFDSVLQECKTLLRVQTYESLQNLGIDVPMRFFSHDNPASKKYMIAEYKKVIVKLKNELLKEKARVEKSEEKKKRIMDAAKDLKPNEVFANAVREVWKDDAAIKGKGKGKGKGKSKGVKGAGPGMEEERVDFTAMATGASAEDAWKPRRFTKAQLADRKKQIGEFFGKGPGAPPQGPNTNMLPQPPPPPPRKGKGKGKDHPSGKGGKKGQTADGGKKGSKGGKAGKAGKGKGKKGKGKETWSGSAGKGKAKGKGKDKGQNAGKNR